MITGAPLTVPTNGKSASIRTVGKRALPPIASEAGNAVDQMIAALLFLKLNAAGWRRRRDRT